MYEAIAFERLFALLFFDTAPITSLGIVSTFLTYALKILIAFLHAALSSVDSGTSISMSSSTSHSINST